jgi:hypothetical protein
VPTTFRRLDETVHAELEALAAAQRMEDAYYEELLSGRLRRGPTLVYMENQYRIKNS